MTQILFHVQVSDRLGYACRLLRKAVRQGAHVGVTADESTLARFDKLLWTFDPIEFVPHVFLRSGDSLALRARVTPVVLAQDPAQAAHCSVLVNLSDDAAHDFERFDRLIEIVSSREDDRDAGRRRWKHYVAQGHTPQKHEASS